MRGSILLKPINKFPMRSFLMHLNITIYISSVSPSPKSLTKGICLKNIANLDYFLYQIMQWNWICREIVTLTQWIIHLMPGTQALAFDLNELLKLSYFLFYYKQHNPWQVNFFSTFRSNVYSSPWGKHLGPANFHVLTNVNFCQGSFVFDKPPRYLFSPLTLPNSTLPVPPNGWTVCLSFLPRHSLQIEMKANLIGSRIYS